MECAHGATSPVSDRNVADRRQSLPSFTCYGQVAVDNTYWAILGRIFRHGRNWLLMDIL